MFKSTTVVKNFFRQFSGVEAETRTVDKGTEITVRTDKKVAVVVKTAEEERIYLPNGSGSDTTYYVEKMESLTSTDEGYAVIHDGDVEDVKVLG